MRVNHLLLAMVVALLFGGCSRPYSASTFPWRESRGNQEEANERLKEAIPYHGTIWMSPRKRIYDSSKAPRKVLYDVRISGFNRAEEKIAENRFVIEAHMLKVVSRDGTAAELTVQLMDELDKKTWTVVYDVSADTKQMKIWKVEGEYVERP